MILAYFHSFEHVVLRGGRPTMKNHPTMYYILYSIPHKVALVRVVSDLTSRGLKCRGATYYVCQNLPSGLWGRGAACLCGVGTCLQGTVGQGCSLVKWWQNLPLWDCVQGCSLFKWCQNLPPRTGGRGVSCLCHVSTYLLRTVGQGHSLFKRCQNLPPGDCWAAVQPVYAVLEPTSQRL